MTKHAFLEGMGLGVLAGAAIGMAVAAKSIWSPDVRRWPGAVRKMDHMKDDWRTPWAQKLKRGAAKRSRTLFILLTFILFMSYLV